MSENSVVRAANTRDIPDIMRIVAGAQAFLKAQGVDQWQDGYPTKEIIAQDIAQGIARVIVHGDAVCAYFALSFDGERTYDTIEGAWITSGAYGVVHRTAVDTSVRRGGLASLSMQYAESEARRLCVPAIRIDTHNDNLPMRRMIEKNGYRYCGVIYIASGAPRVAYEKAL